MDDGKKTSAHVVRGGFSHTVIFDLSQFPNWSILNKQTKIKIINTLCKKTQLKFNDGKSGTFQIYPSNINDYTDTSIRIIIASQYKSAHNVHEITKYLQAAASALDPDLYTNSDNFIIEENDYESYDDEDDIIMIDDDEE